MRSLIRFAVLGGCVCVGSFEASSPDASGQEKAVLKVEEIRRINTGDQGIIRVAVSPDGQLALSGGSDGTIRLWALKTGKELKKIKAHNGQTYTVAFHPGGRLALSGGDNAQLLLWDLHEGKPIRNFQGHEDTVFGASFSHDGKRIASGSWDRSVRVWDVETGKEVRRLDGHTDGVLAVAFAPDDKQLASAGGDKTVRLWDLQSGQEVRAFSGHTAMIRDMAFSPDGRHILSGGYDGDGTGRLWDVQTGAEVHRLKGIPQGVHGVAISPDGQRGLLAGGYQTQLWDLPRGTLVHTFWGWFPTHAAFLPRGDEILLASQADHMLRHVRAPRGLAPDNDPPVSGNDAPGVDVLDSIMLKYRKMIGCSAASLSIARGSQILFSRGYGWRDHDGTLRMHANTPMGLASCMKPLTAAMIRQLALDGKLDLNASVCKLLKIEPAGRVVDQRIYDITVNHLLEHKAGWQEKALGQAVQAYETAGGKPRFVERDSVWVEKVLALVMTQQLDWTPGEKDQYDNFGYGVLSLIVVRASGVSYPDYLRSRLCRPFGVHELKWVRQDGPPRGEEPPRLWKMYPDIEPLLDTWVSTEAVCTFMRCFWIDGTPRDDGNPTWIMNGSTDDSTAQMYWRSDGINLAFVFHGRGGGAEHDAISAELNQALDSLIQGGRLPPPHRRATNLLVNGGFEQGPQVDGFVALDAGSTAIKGWNVTRGQIDLCESHWMAAAGKRSLDLHGSPGYGGIAQTFPTRDGQHYRVSFSLAGSPGGNPAVKHIGVSAAGKKAEFAFDSTGKTHESMGWVRYAWEFEATSDRTRLEFFTRETEDPFAGPALDEVHVQALP